MYRGSPDSVGSEIESSGPKATTAAPSEVGGVGLQTFDHHDSGGCPAVDPNGLALRFQMSHLETISILCHPTRRTVS